jgi:hypothetical protein
MAGAYRRMYNGKLYILYASSNITRVIKWNRRVAGHVARMGMMRSVCRVLVGKPEQKRPLGRRRHKREDSIREIG